MQDKETKEEDGPPPAEEADSPEVKGKEQPTEKFNEQQIADVNEAIKRDDSVQEVSAVGHITDDGLERVDMKSMMNDMPSEEDLETYRIVFELFDRDRSGYIDRHDMAAIAVKLGKEPREGKCKSSLFRYFNILYLCPSV